MLLLLSCRQQWETPTFLQKRRGERRVQSKKRKWSRADFRNVRNHPDVHQVVVYCTVVIHEMPAGRNMVLSLFDRCMVDFWGISRLKCMKPDTIDNPKNIGLCRFREPSEWGSPARRNWIDCKSWWVCLHILYDYISHSSISTTSYPQLSQWSLWLWPLPWGVGCVCVCVWGGEREGLLSLDNVVCNTIK